MRQGAGRRLQWDRTLALGAPLALSPLGPWSPSPKGPTPHREINVWGWILGGMAAVCLWGCVWGWGATGVRLVGRLSCMEGGRPGAVREEIVPGRLFRDVE